MKIRITLQSFLLTGSGEGSALIDTDVVFHKYGFPFIPARRIKGMLRESLTEVLEIEGKVYDGVDKKSFQKVDELFGRNDQAGKLVFSNGYLKNWTEIKKEIKDEVERLKDKNTRVLIPSNIRKYYTTEIQQTAIDNKSGIAKDTSLRNYRVIKPLIQQSPVFFDAEISIPLQEIDLLRKAIKNLRYAGLRRNRGFGKVHCELITKNEKEKIETRKDENVELQDENVELQDNDSKNKIEAQGDRLHVTLKTLSPLALTLQLGEKNTVFTEKVISGNRLRGLLAELYIMNTLSGKVGLAHSDADFKEIFLTGKVRFETLFKDGIEPIPLHIHGFKGDDKKKPVDIFNWINTDNSITKPVGGLGTHTKNRWQKNAPDSTFFFHNSRKDRTAGRSVKDQAEGGIFYYEALDEDQEFTGMIWGSNDVLKKLTGAISETNVRHIGRSRSAQYGEIEITLSNPTEATNKIPDTGAVKKSITPTGNSSIVRYLLVLQTPLILVNQYGEPEADERSLINYIRKFCGFNETIISIEKSASAFTYVEQYNVVWQSKSGKLPAFKEGSSFVVKLESPTDHFNNTLLQLQEHGLGELTDQGFGKIKIEPFYTNDSLQEEVDIEEKTLVQENEDITHKKSTDDNIPKNETLQKIYRQIKREDEEVKAKTKALEDAKKHLSLSNHLISRLERMVSKYETEEAMKKWVENVIKKPAGEALRKVKILNDKDEFEFKKVDVIEDITGKQKAGVAGTDQEVFELNKLYWLTLLQGVRKLKKHESNGGE